MPNIRLILFVVWLCSCGNIASAASITVVSNADSGPGTLRDALTQAAANGTTMRDSIIFSIADNSLAGRTISLLSPLPALTSNLAVNGISQAGAAIGVSDAHILLFHGTAPGNFKFLSIEDCTDVAIYGLAMINIANHANDTIEGISYVRCHNLHIGRPGAGNYIFGCTHAIRCNTGTYGSDKYFSNADTSRLLIIQSNIVGLDMAGGFSNQYNGVQPPIMYNTVLLIHTSDIIIGGDDPAEGNTIVDQNSIPMNYPGGEGLHFVIETGRDVGMGLLKIKNNKLGTRKDGTLDPNYRLFPVQINILGNFRTDYTIEIKDNILYGLVWMTNIGNYFTIQGNTIFSAWINEVYDCAFTFFSCFGGGIVGGDNPGEGNTIMNAYTDVSIHSPGNWVASVRFDLASHVTMRKNVTLCNNYAGSTYINVDAGSYYNTYAYARVDSTSSGFVRGKATPDTRVDVYLDDDCLACEGKQWLGFTMAAADSSWQYIGNFNGAIVATSTSPGNGQTSPFSEPAIQDYWVRVKQPTCGKDNGYIKGLQVNGCDNVKWHYMTLQNGVWKDSLYATTLDLVNAKPGLYYFDAWLGKSCRSFFRSFTLSDTRITVDSSYISVDQPTCGQFNGAVRNLYLPSSQDVGVYWKNESGDIVSRALALTGAGPGRYKLIFQDTVGGCIDSTGVYELRNLSGPTVDINHIQINSSTCGRSNGSISNIQFSNVTGSAVYIWLDSNDKITGNSPDLINLPAGRYRLKFKDESACDTIITPFITVTSAGTIQFDNSAMQIIPSKCLAPTGSIQRINILNGSTYKWTDTLSGQAVGNGADLLNAAPGYYRLTATNAYGCTNSAGPFHIPQEGAVPLSATFNTHDEACDRKDGNISINTLNPSVTNYSFEWTEKNTSQVVGSGQSVENLSSGYYSLYVTDQNGCRQMVATVFLPNDPAPVITHAGIEPDICQEKNGAVLLSVQGSAPFTYSWYDETAQLLTQSADLTSRHAGSYYVKIADANHCSVSSAEYVIKDSSLLIDAPVYTDQILLKGNAATLNPVNPEAGNYSLYRSPGTDPAQQNTSGIFVTGPISQDTTVYIVFQKGNCSSMAVPVHIQAVETLVITMPNSFTPNNDGHNDLFRVKYPQGIKAFHMFIYNRWGQKVFETSDPYLGWDGMINGIYQPMGTFVWFISYKDILGNSRKISGSTVLIR